MTMQPAKHIEIPEGATHWVYGMTYPFEKHVNGRYIYVKNKWVPIGVVNKGQHDYRANPTKLKQIEIPENAKSVDTVYGEGKIIEKSEHNILVVLESKRFDYSPVSITKKEII